MIFRINIGIVLTIFITSAYADKLSSMSVDKLPEILSSRNDVQLKFLDDDGKNCRMLFNYYKWSERDLVFDCTGKKSSLFGFKPVESRENWYQMSKTDVGLISGTCAVLWEPTSGFNPFNGAHIKDYEYNAKIDCSHNTGSALAIEVVDIMDQSFLVKIKSDVGYLEWGDDIFSETYRSAKFNPNSNGDTFELFFEDFHNY